MVEFQYPHNIIIERINDDPYSDDPITTQEIYRGPCNAQVGSFGEKSSVVDADYTVYIGALDFEPKRGDEVTIIFPSWSDVKGVIKQREKHVDFGITLWITENGN